MRLLTLMLAALLVVPAAAAADTILDFGGMSLPEWKFQAVYREKYFENTVQYRLYEFYYTNNPVDPFYTQKLSAMRHNFTLRAGLPDNYTATADFLYVYQNYGPYNYNNLQAVTLFGEKYFDWWGVLAGLKIPVGNEMARDVAIIDSRDEFNLTLGVFARVNAGIFRFSLRGVSEMNVLPDRDCQGAITAGGSAGINFFTSEFQAIDLVLEAEYGTKLYRRSTPYVLYVVPQVAVDFYNDFSLIIGVQFYAFAKETFINENTSPVFLVKLSYLLNSDLRAEKEKVEEKEEEKKEKKWWQIEGVDDEMVPESWKDEEYMKKRQKNVQQDTQKEKTGP